VVRVSWAEAMCIDGVPGLGEIRKMMVVSEVGVLAFFTAG